MLEKDKHTTAGDPHNYIYPCLTFLEKANGNNQFSFHLSLASENYRVHVLQDKDNTAC